MAKRLIIELLAMAALGMLIGLLGPFGTFAMPTAERMAHWVIWLLVGYAFFRPVGVIARWLCDATGMPAPAGTLIAVMVGAFPVTVVIAVMSMQVSNVLRWAGFWWLYFYILLVCLVVSFVMTALFRQGSPHAAAPSETNASGRDPTNLQPPPAPSTPSTPSPPSAVVSVPETVPALPLPTGFGSVLALKGEDHYVRVIGAGREELILMRMRDAIAGLDSADGLRVHRSWWIARDAVQSVRRDGRAAIITLTSGHEAPVARDMMPGVRAAGWL